MEPSLRERLAENLTAITATVVTGTWLAAMLLGFSWWLAFMLFGYIVIVPVVALLFDDEETEQQDDGEFESAARSAERDSADADPLAELRRRYANGELTDEQFERKLDKLLETETLEDASEWRQRERETARDR